MEAEWRLHSHDSLGDVLDHPILGLCRCDMHRNTLSQMHQLGLVLAVRLESHEHHSLPNVFLGHRFQLEPNQGTFIWRTWSVVREMGYWCFHEVICAKENVVFKKSMPLKWAIHFWKRVSNKITGRWSSPRKRCGRRSQRCRFRLQQQQSDGAGCSLLYWQSAAWQTLERSLSHHQIQFHALKAVVASREVHFISF